MSYLVFKAAAATALALLFLEVSLSIVPIDPLYPYTLFFLFIVPDLFRAIVPAAFMLFGIRVKKVKVFKFKIK